MNSTNAIGVFDSGLGGLTVLKELLKILPNEDYIYLGDTARVPYGTRSNEIIIKFALQDTAFLIKKDVKAIVIACNTASSVASNALRKMYSVPIFDVVTSTDKMFNHSNPQVNGVVIMGTMATIKSNKYQNIIARNYKKARIRDISCPLLVPLVEEEELDTDITKSILKKYLGDIDWNIYSHLIIGCTHYPLLLNALRKIIGKNIEIINPGYYTALDVNRYLHKSKLINSGRKKGVSKYFITDITDNFVKKASMFLGEKIDNHTQRVSIE